MSLALTNHEVKRYTPSSNTKYIEKFQIKNTSPLPWLIWVKKILLTKQFESRRVRRACSSRLLFKNENIYENMRIWAALHKYVFASFGNVSYDCFQRLCIENLSSKGNTKSARNRIFSFNISLPGTCFSTGKWRKVRSWQKEFLHHEESYQNR